MNHFLTRSVSRRELLGLGSATAAGVALGAGWTYTLYRKSFFDALKVTSYRFATPRWPVDMPRLRIAFLSDLHVGSKAVDLKTVGKIVDQINALEPDIILLGGDFLINRAGNLFYNAVAPNDIGRALQPLRAPLGVYAVLGNHDWAVDGKGMWDALEANGIKVLENDFQLIDMTKGDDKKGFYLVGIADFLTRKPAYKDTIDAINPDHPQIVFAHDPYVFKDMPSGPLIQLSGHTHGGQVSLPLIGPIVNPTKGAPLRWLYGLIEEGGKTMLISSGVGTSSLPVKNTPNEVVLLTIETSTTLAS